MSIQTKSESSWRPAPRPDWVAKINEEGRHLDIRSLVPMDADSLMARAQRNTGLKDFGSDDWREPFAVLTRALEEESDLNLVGRLMTAAELLSDLEARLRIEEEYRKHPEIEQQQIVRPLFVLGQPRTGTSALQNVLTADPDNGTIRTYEAWFPAPVSYDPGEQNARIARAEGLAGMWNRVTPEFMTQHEMSATAPNECNLIHGLAFRSRTMVHFGQIPSYNAWMATADMTPALKYHIRVLKLLQFRNQVKRWVLKSPDYISMIPELIANYPDCCFVYTHRDPYKAFGSAVSLIGTLQWQRSDSVFRYEARESVAVNETNVAALLSNVVDMIEKGVIEKHRLFNAQFRDIVADPLAVAEAVYEYFGIQLKPAAHDAMRRYVAANRNERKGQAHVYPTGDKQDVERFRTAFRRYQEYFGVPNEV
jgi:Sulfotransferase family